MLLFPHIPFPIFSTLEENNAECESINPLEWQADKAKMMDTKKLKNLISQSSDVPTAKGWNLWLQFTNFWNPSFPTHFWRTEENREKVKYSKLLDYLFLFTGQDRWKTACNIKENI